MSPLHPADFLPTSRRSTQPFSFFS
ncbi:hypothetical protein DPC53_00175 (plasmid) [Escherichia coli]|nr:hypothetical protein DPC53_00175 [Escherichia coli]